MTTIAERDRETTRKIAGVRLNPAHWASTTVHAHRTWQSDTTMEVWCGIVADFEDGAKQTFDLVSCLGCAQASLLACRGI